VPTISSDLFIECSVRNPRTLPALPDRHKEGQLAGTNSMREIQGWYSDRV
jgi:hypothetical protein